MLKDKAILKLWSQVRYDTIRVRHDYDTSLRQGYDKELTY